jgi:hypothetical protein
MSSSQADRFQQQYEAHVDNQLPKWVGANPMVMPIFRNLDFVRMAEKHCPVLVLLASFFPDPLRDIVNRLLLQPTGTLLGIVTVASLKHLQEAHKADRP